MSNPTFESIYPGALQLARRKASRLVGHFGVTSSDVEDVASELVIEFWRCFGTFDSNRSTWRTFARTIMHRRLISLCRYYAAERRGGLASVISLSRRMNGLDGESAELSESILVERSGNGVVSPPARRTELLIDLDRAVPASAVRLRRLARGLLSQRLTEISLDSGCSRTTLYADLKQLRRRLVAFGIDQSYLARCGGAR